MVHLGIRTARRTMSHLGRGNLSGSGNMERRLAADKNGEKGNAGAGGTALDGAAGEKRLAGRFSQERVGTAVDFFKREERRAFLRAEKDSCGFILLCGPGMASVRPLRRSDRWIFIVCWRQRCAFCRRRWAMRRESRFIWNRVSLPLRKETDGAGRISCSGKNGGGFSADGVPDSGWTRKNAFADGM